MKRVEKDCDNCRHSFLEADKEPCKSCFTKENLYSNWESEEE